MATTDKDETTKRWEDGVWSVYKGAKSLDEQLVLMSKAVGIEVPKIPNDVDKKRYLANLELERYNQLYGSH